MSAASGWGCTGLHNYSGDVFYWSAAFTPSPSDVIVSRGNPVTFDCIFTSSGPVSVNWQRNGSVLPPAPPKYTYLINNSLVISPTETGDEGTYSCVVTDQATMETVSHNTSLTFACEFARRSILQNLILHNNCQLFRIPLCLGLRARQSMRDHSSSSSASIPAVSLPPPLRGP